MNTTAAATPARTPGIVVSTPIAAGRLITGNHTEGVVVSTAITAGAGAKDGTSLNHAEGVVGR